MGKSSFIHGVSIVAGIWGFFALLGAWIAGEGGTVWGFTYQHCINDAIILTLISISAGVCAMYRRQLEREER
ncbi:MAG: hypothetical protein AAB407_02840 [Patescibacteria group bacterium]